MDRILSYLPDKVNVMFGWSSNPWDYPRDHITYRSVCVPKSWLEHRERGRYNEWTIKEEYKEELAKKFGDEFLHSTERLEVLEWNQLENIAYMIKRSRYIGFDDILDRVQKVDLEDAIYTHSIGI